MQQHSSNGKSYRVLQYVQYYFFHSFLHRFSYIQIFLEKFSNIHIEILVESLRILCAKRAYKLFQQLRIFVIYWLSGLNLNAEYKLKKMAHPKAVNIQTIQQYAEVSD
jgi:hypothetical protein